MSLAYTVRKVVDEVAGDLSKKHGIAITSKDIENTLDNYMRTLKGLMEKGTHDVDTSFIKRMEVPGIGFLRYNENIIKKKEETVNRKEIDNYEGIRVAVTLKKVGWHLLNWTQENGYIFYNEFTEKAYGLKREGLFGNFDAYMYFDKIKDTEFVKEGFAVYLGENIKEVNLVHGEIVVYNRLGMLIKRFNTLEEASKFTYFSKKYIHSVLLYNWDNELIPKRIRNTYWFFNKNYGNYKRFRATNITTYNKTIIDLINVKTGKIMLKFGTASDIVEYISSLGNSDTIRTSTILRLLDTNKSMYGYKYRTSVLQTNKQ